MMQKIYRFAGILPKYGISEFLLYSCPFPSVKNGAVI
jgi:hypothetical protein